MLIWDFLYNVTTITITIILMRPANIMYKTVIKIVCIRACLNSFVVCSCGFFPSETCHSIKILGFIELSFVFNSIRSRWKYYFNDRKLQIYLIEDELLKKCEKEGRERENIRFWKYVIYEIHLTIIQFCSIRKK